MAKPCKHGLAFIFLRDSLCLPTVSLSRQRYDIRDFSFCPLPRVLHVTLANGQDLDEFHLRSSPSAFRSKQLFTVAILGFQFGLYHVVAPLRFLRSISLAPFFSILSIFG